MEVCPRPNASEVRRLIKHLFEVSLVFRAPMGYNSYRRSIEHLFAHESGGGRHEHDDQQRWGGTPARQRSGDGPGHLADPAHPARPAVVWSCVAPAAWRGRTLGRAPGCSRRPRRPGRPGVTPGDRAVRIATGSATPRPRVARAALNHLDGYEVDAGSSSPCPGRRATIASIGAHAVKRLIRVNAGHMASVIVDPRRLTSPPTAHHPIAVDRARR